MKLKHAWIAGALTLCAPPALCRRGHHPCGRGPGQASLAEELTARATVTAIDLATRKVSLKKCRRADPGSDRRGGGDQPSPAQGGRCRGLRYLQLLDLTLLKGTARVRKRVVEVEGGKGGAGRNLLPAPACR